MKYVEFHVDRDAAKAGGYFKAINGAIPDRFDVTSQMSTGRPVADFTCIVEPLFTVRFADASSDTDGTVVGWSWDFDDGPTSALQNPSHDCAAAGNYSVTLRVTDNDEATAQFSESVTMSESPAVVTVSGFTPRRWRQPPRST